ncbi:MAG TPA: radical SAM protein [Xanthomonadales bacterium]|nr:radical SAM protein [Xanthomonadales bacterium]
MRRCTAACDHCCIGSSPRATGAIPVERMHSLIDEAKRIPSIERVVFTGGECFLLGRDLDGLIAHAHELELETRVITNAYWAVNEHAARQRIAALHTAGLDQMMISTGTFHQRFVPVERVVFAARAAAAASIPARIAIEVCDQQTFDESILRDGLSVEIAARRVFLGHDPWTLDVAGRGQSRVSNDELLANGGAGRAVGRCADILDTITVTPDQQVLACCGFPMEQLPHLRIAALGDEALDELVRDAPNDLLKIWLHVAGPHGIAEFVARYVPGYELPPSVSICQACAALQLDPQAMAVVTEHGGEIVESIFATFTQLNGGLEPLRVL